MFLLITKTQIITNMYNLQRPFHTTNHTRHYMYCTKRLIAAGGNTVSLPCNNAFRQCWAQRAPSCCIKKQYLITKIVINWFTSLQTGERSRDRSKHYLFVEDRLHIYRQWETETVATGASQVYCFTTQNSLWRKETRWTMCTKVGGIIAVFTSLSRFIDS